MDLSALVLLDRVVCSFFALWSSFVEFGTMKFLKDVELIASERDSFRFGRDGMKEFDPKQPILGSFK